MRFASVFSRLRPAMLLGAVALLPSALHAQSPGSFDNTFLSPLVGSTAFTVTNEYVETISGPLEYVVQGGDVGGLFITYGNSLLVQNYAYPNIGGTGRIVYTAEIEKFLDPSTSVYKVLIGGSFGDTDVDGKAVPTGNITRLDTLTGTIDPNFNVGAGANDFVTAILPLSDGSTLVGGTFTRFNKQSYPRLVRLAREGAIDPDFKPVAISDGVFALGPETDPVTGKFGGTVIVSGTFNTIGKSGYTKLARIDLSGNIDSSFQPDIDARVLAVATQPDGKIVIGGQFSLVNGQTVGHLARLNHDGSLDTTFNASVSGLPANTSAPVAVYVLKLLSDGRLYVGGQFSAVDGTPRQYLGLINPDGSLDASFDPGTVITNSVQSLALQTDGRIFVGETVSKKDAEGNFPRSLIRLYGALPSVNLAVKKSQAVVAGPLVERRYGTVALTRGAGNLTTPLTVAFQIGGTAQAQLGESYNLTHVSLAGGNIYTATFAPNQTRFKFKIKTTKHLLPTTPETLTFTLLPAQGFTSDYEPGASTTATVFISSVP